MFSRFEYYSEVEESYSSVKSFKYVFELFNYFKDSYLVDGLSSFIKKPKKGLKYYFHLFALFVDLNYERFSF